MEEPLAELKPRRRIMRHSSSTGVLIAVAVLIVSLAAPAAAKKGGNPGPPSGTGLEVTVEPSGVFMWANSVGDEILFDITVTNTSGDSLSPVTVVFNDLENDIELATFDLGRNQSWTMEYPYTVEGSISADGNTGDFHGAPIDTQTEVMIGTVSAAVNGEVLDSAPAVMTAYPVQPCPPAAEDGSFTWGPNSEDYTVCALTPPTPSYWTMTTELPKPKKGNGPISPAVTARDGVPGNWCHHDTDGELPQDVSEDRLAITDRVFFPADGVCLGGGAGGDTIPVRNHDTFYLATWKDNVVVAAPSS